MSPITVNLDGVEAWEGGGEILPPGRHHVKVTSAQPLTSSGGHPQIELELTAVDESGQIRDWVTITQASLGRVRQVLEALQYPIQPGPFQLDERRLVGRQCEILVREEQYEGKARSRVAAYQPSASAPVPSDPFQAAEATVAANRSNPTPF